MNASICKSRKKKEMAESGETVLIKDSHGKPAKWYMDFMPVSYSYRCKLIVDEEIYRGLGKTPERAMKNAVNRYLRKKGRI